MTSENLELRYNVGEYPTMMLHKKEYVRFRFPKDYNAEFFNVEVFSFVSSTCFYYIE